MSARLWADPDVSNYCGTSNTDPGSTIVGIQTIDFADLDLNSSNLSLNNPVAKSWFSTIKISPRNPNLWKTYSPFSTSSPAVCMENEVTPKELVKCLKIRIYPTAQQRGVLRRWDAKGGCFAIGASRFVFNKTVEYLRQPGTKAQWMKVAPVIKQDLPEWSKEIPYQIKKISVRDACFSVRDAKKKTKSDSPSFVKFRSRRDRVQSVFIPSTAISPKGVYHTILGELKLSQPLPGVIKDSRLILHRGRFFLCVSTVVSVSASENQTGSICSLDPGVRTFLSFYSPECAGKLGDKDFGRIHRLGFYLDGLVSKIALTKGGIKRRLKKAAERMRNRISNLVKEIHHQAANWLTKNFQVILLPTFETSQMASRSGRKLRSKTVRAMLTWCHYQFQQFLLHKAQERGKTVLLVTEEYTSKTVNWTGEIDQKLGGKKKIRSKISGTWMDRDINGALGIFLKALGDTPCLDKVKTALAG